MNEEKVIPEISIIIPMYNVEQYVSDCLDSVLVQTFKDYEVIIVDDCSTDNSCSVVESYMPKFNGNLKLVHTETNSGGCAAPRNIGLTYARGKYIFFLDSDDLIIKTGLAELYKVAEDYQADVIQCEKFYTSDTPKLKGALLTVKSFKMGRFVKNPELDSRDIAQRMEDFHNFQYVWTAWSKLIRRSFMEENNIKFPDTHEVEDVVFTIYCISCAQRYVRVPNIVNIYRYRPDSILHKKVDVSAHIRKWIRALINGFYCCDNFLSEIDFFKEHPEIKYIALDAVVQDIFRRFKKVYSNIPPAHIDGIIREEFAAHGDCSAIAAFLFNLSNLYELHLSRLLNSESGIKNY